uniref:Ribosomal protein L30 n=1 Tax=Amorphochlora amoebiformis TaxID=1561963 RepID=A0A0H5BKZ2_9EUKA|nr:ribosomal protein L30 [Amorphochlora amoebiformis]
MSINTKSHMNLLDLIKKSKTMLILKKNKKRVSIIGAKKVRKFLICKKSYRLYLVKLIIMSKSSLNTIKSTIIYYCLLNSVKYYIYDGTDLELGAILNKNFRTNCIAICK